MDAELQALRDARLAQLKGNTSNNNGSQTNSSNGNNAPTQNIGASVAPFLEANALERLSRVALVRPDRATAVEQYVKQLVSTGQVQRKITEEQIVQILNGVAREQNKQNETKIIFDRKDKSNFEVDSNNKNETYDSEDDFFDDDQLVVLPNIHIHINIHIDNLYKQQLCRIIKKELEEYCDDPIILFAPKKKTIKFLYRQFHGENGRQKISICNDRTIYKRRRDMQKWECKGSFYRHRNGTKEKTYYQ